MSDRMIHRHTKLAIFMHWFNAGCWIALLLTGLGLIKNEQLNPLGAWFPAMMRSTFGGGENLLAVFNLGHETQAWVKPEGYSIIDAVYRGEAGTLPPLGGVLLRKQVI